MEHQHRRRGVGPDGLPARNVYNPPVSFVEGSNFVILLRLAHILCKLSRPADRTIQETSPRYTYFGVGSESLWIRLTCQT